MKPTQLDELQPNPEIWQHFMYPRSRKEIKKQLSHMISTFRKMNTDQRCFVYEKMKHLPYVKIAYETANNLARKNETDDTP
jgi:hypothetical protein